MKTFEDLANDAMEAAEKAHDHKMERNAALKLEAAMEALDLAGRADAVAVDGSPLTVNEAFFVVQALRRARKALEIVHDAIEPYRRA